jgi:hypothetical protein
MNGPAQRRSVATTCRGSRGDPDTLDTVFRIHISAKAATKKFVAGKANVLLHVTAFGHTQQSASMIIASEKELLPRNSSASSNINHVEPTIAKRLGRISALKS